MEIESRTSTQAGGEFDYLFEFSQSPEQREGERRALKVNWLSNLDFLCSYVSPKHLDFFGWIFRLQ